MGWLIGIDEAGYGPNLGPLTIGGSLWQTTPFDRGGADDLFALLAPQIGSVASSDAARWLAVDDSKRLYAPQSGLAPLERVALGASFSASAADPAAREARPRDLEDLSSRWQLSTSSDTAESAAPLESPLPWYLVPTLLPTAESVPQLDELAARFDALTRDRGVALKRVTVERIEPERFNREVERWGNKASLLSLESLRRVRALLDEIGRVASDDRSPVLVRCDRHGGRARYLAVLQQVFPDERIEVLDETSGLSRYRWSGRRPVEIRFQVGSEQFLETAWASVVAKYVRELSIDAFNRFWIGHLPDLAPTRGYPVDAKRFRGEIEPLARRLAIPAERYWRSR